MRLSPQSSQRSTWPPSAAVRHTSIAAMTLVVPDASYIPTHVSERHRPTGGSTAGEKFNSSSTFSA